MLKKSLLILLTTVFLVGCEYFEYENKAVINTANLNIRQEPSIKSKVVQFVAFPKNRTS